MLHEAYIPPRIEEDEPVFIRFDGEVRFDPVRAEIVDLLTFRLENDLNHVQFMGGYALAPFASQSYPEEHRAFLLEWEKQTRRVHWVARELGKLGTDPQPIIDETNYSMGGGKRKHALFATPFQDWIDVLVWRWMRARAHCARAMMEFGSIYIPLSDIAFQTYFDLGLTRWPASSSQAAIERVLEAYRLGGHDRIVEAIRKWYPLAKDYTWAEASKAERRIDMRLWIRGPDQIGPGFEEQIRTDLGVLGIPRRVLGEGQGEGA